jgi:hypothetical protein
MPITIKMDLPGNPRTTVEPFSGVYRITVEREDGIACTEIEARTAMSVYCFKPPKEVTTKVKAKAK